MRLLAIYIHTYVGTYIRVYACLHGKSMNIEKLHINFYMYH